ncbi:hypothetical protein OHA70_05805 [Kribbella sp. NBC_00382]|uniref:hypothetical protein n=1 Tax=Kribbella sp. NBC_00382 TaxID=2975967 RepID=UPI002E206AFC
MTAEISAADKQLLKARALWKHTTVRNRVRPPLKLALAEMAPGRGRCMYCGDNEGADIDHFEPMGVTPLRTYDWNNHLWACSICNSHMKRDQFPISANGDPLLLNPVIDDPGQHLHLALAAGEYIALTKRGESTIEVFELNRAVLSRGRRHALGVVSMAIKNWQNDKWRADLVGMRLCVDLIREQPFADVATAMLHQAHEPSALSLFSFQPELVPILRDSELRESLGITPA